MPNLDRTGPRGFGPMSGRGMGFCGGARAYGAGRGYGQCRGYRAGFGRGFGPGMGLGWGAGVGWAAVGYGTDESASMRAALESRREFLRAELARTDALLAEERPARDSQGDEKAGS